MLQHVSSEVVVSPSSQLFYSTAKLLFKVGENTGFKLLMEEEPQIIRIALHPRDPHQVLEEQKEMIYKLKKMHYKMVTYKELTPKL